MNLKDNQVTLADIKSELKIFNDKRDWLKDHDPKGLAEAISIEAAELLEIFLWLDRKEASDKIAESFFQERVREELADVMIYCLNFALNSELDVSELIHEKLQKNALKYPELKK